MMMRRSRILPAVALLALGLCTLLPPVARVTVSMARAQTAAPLIVDGDFEKTMSGTGLRGLETPRGWYESRSDGVKGPKLVRLTKKALAGNATKKAFFKASRKANAYLSQAFPGPQTGRFSLQWDLLVRRVLPKPNRSAYMLVGNDAVTGKGPNATGSERFVFLAFENAATKGKLNLVALEAASGKPRVVVPGLDADKWYTVKVDIDVPGKSYAVSVAGVTPAPVTVKAFQAKEKTIPASLTHISFATWNDGPGTFFVDNVR
jgi:hypothetical protein